MNTVSVRRPEDVNLFAILANVSAVFYLCVAVTGIVLSPRKGIALWIGVGVYGLFRLAASYGLRRMKSFGALFELSSAYVWVAGSIALSFFLFRDLPGGAGAEIASFLLPGFAISILEIWRLGRPSIRPLFARGSDPGVPVSAASQGIWIVSIVAGIALLSIALSRYLLPAMEHSRQKRTMADMQTIATAWESRATDFNRYNAAAITFPTGDVTIDDVATCLTPTYLKVFPRKDGWGNDWRFGLDQPWRSKADAQVYVIISYGKDGKSQGKWTGGETTDFDCDIIYSNGSFLQYPYPK